MKANSALNNFLFLIILLTFNNPLNAQSVHSKFVGIYGDWFPNGQAGITELELRADGTFRLNTVDHIYPQTSKSYSNEGVWLVKGKKIYLNPDLTPRKPSVQIKENTIGLEDSIQIIVNHFVELYENQQLIEQKKTDFEILTLYYNKKKDFNHLTRDWLNENSCAWAPRIKNRVNIDSTNTYKIAKKEIEQIGVYTYGFKDFIEKEIKNKNSDYFEIDVIVPIDKERMPRNKQVIIKGNTAFFYENRKGKVDLFLARPLTKKKNKNHLQNP